MKEINTLAFLIGACVMTGCSGLTFSTHDVVWAGTPDGTDSMGDVLTGIQVMTKTEPADLPQNPHSAMRVAQDKERSNRLKFRIMLNRNEQGEK